MEEPSIQRVMSQRYPREQTVRGGLTITLTPMVPSDWELLKGFLQTIPDEDRLFLRHDISDPGIVERWCQELDYKHIFPLLAWVGGEIVADATLHQDPDLWTAHLGRLRLLVHPNRRRLGIGTLLVKELCDVARQLQLHKIVVECTPAQVEILGMLERLGFREAARLEGFVLDRDDHIHDMLVLVRNLR